MNEQWMIDGEGEAAFLFAHGAGAPMDSDFMNAVAEGIAARGVRVVRFEFPYMHERRRTGRRRPPNRMPQLEEHFRAVVSELRESHDGPLFVGGKSMGGRVASRLADELEATGVICFGYPFHPPKKPEKLRTAHLEELRSPALILQGERDKFGVPEEVEGYVLADTVEVVWLPDGDHSLKPRKSSGHTLEENLATAIEAAVSFIDAHS